MNYGLHDEITAKYILERIREEDLYIKYLGIEPVVGKMYLNPLRPDNNPTCNFNYINGKLVFRDWSEHTYMDVFDVIQRKYRINYKQALELISSDFGLKDGAIPKPLFILPSRPVKVPKPRYYVEVQPLTDTDISYLYSYGITPEIAKKFNVFSVKVLFVNEKVHYHYREYNPAIGYYFGLNSKGQQKWKIYFYKKVSVRFLSNTSRINGWVQLPEKGDIVVITKSMKDVMSLYRLGIPAVATQGESVLLRKETIEELMSRFTYIASHFDFDPAGIRTALKLRREYGIPAYMLTDGKMGSINYGSKDISDYIKQHGLIQAQTLVDKAKNHLVHETITNLNYPSISS